MRKINLNVKSRRKIRVRSKITGTKERPRIAVFRSNKYIYAQAIDDQNRTTVASGSTLKLKNSKQRKVDGSRAAGMELGKILMSKKIKEAVFDRSIYSYKGRVKSFCEGLREAGIKI